IQDLVEILTGPKNAIIKQYKPLFEEENVKLDFTQEALQAMAQKTKDTGTGARALRMIAETMLRDLMFEVPSDPTIREIIIEKDTVLHHAQPRIVRSESA